MPLPHRLEVVQILTETIEDKHFTPGFFGLCFVLVTFTRYQILGAIRVKLRYIYDDYPRFSRWIELGWMKVGYHKLDWKGRGKFI